MPEVLGEELDALVEGTLHHFRGGDVGAIEVSGAADAHAPSRLPRAAFALQAAGGGVQVGKELIGRLEGAGDADTGTGALCGQPAGVGEHLRAQHDGTALYAGVEEVAELEAELLAQGLGDTDLVVAGQADNGGSAWHSTSIVLSGREIVN